MLAQVFSRLGCCVYTLTVLPLLGCCVYTLTVLPLLVPGLSLASPILTPQEHPPDPGAWGAFYTSLLEQENDMDLQDLLQQFVSSLNLTELRPRPRARAARKEPPEYMLELYNRFTNDHTTVPSASIVRSFKNEDSSPHRVTLRGVTTHPLLFNISFPRHERITAAQLRLHALLRSDRPRHVGLRHMVTVYEIHQGGPWRGRAGPEARRDGGRGGEMEELATWVVRGENAGWMTFDLTHALRLWQNTEHTTHRLEVHIASTGAQCGERPPKVAEDNGRVLDGVRDSSPEGKHTPVIIVFSDDPSRQEDKQELDQMIKHEDDLPAVPESGSRPPWGGEGWPRGSPDAPETDQRFLAQLRSNLISDRPPRIRRHANEEPCKRTPLFVEFKDIGWDSWVIQPLGYEAYRCNGVCSPPMTSEVSPTKHAIIQTLLSAHNPQKASRACCVPTKLEPISLLYYEDGGVVTYKHKYEGMVVAECGCR